MLNGTAYLPQFVRNIIDALIRCWRVHLKGLTTPCCSSYLSLDHDNDMLDAGTVLVNEGVGCGSCRRR